MGIKRVLIANRGEIALRAIRTIKEMGKEAVAIYSTADTDTRYLDFADAKVCVGSERSKDSYLNIPSIISAAEIYNADAVFPGYGFLSENADFVEICRHHNIKFIGPNPETMNMMSNKSDAKTVMQEAGVPVVPGSKAALGTIEEARELAAEIGYPVILKASSGGGGRGMRIVKSEDKMRNLFLAAESEAISAFGDGAIYMEKFIENPRHIEVQIIGDTHGNVIHLGERDCSLQRRHQKLIEESPAIFLDEATRKKLHETAVNAAKHINYVGAGTFEFLVDKDRNFYFMEMNTRLQVEHPVSEMVSGFDIIRLMIETAEGKALPKQEEVTIKGHAIECRISAEDPKTFIPSPGKITQFYAPGGRNVRVDTHAYCNYTVPMYYDSMIGKLIVWGDDRNEAIGRMKRALGEFEIEGVKSTIDFHREMMNNQDFVTNSFDTRYLE